MPCRRKRVSSIRRRRRRPSGCCGRLYLWYAEEGRKRPQPDIAFHDLTNESRIIRDAALTLTHDSSSFFPLFSFFTSCAVLFPLDSFFFLPSSTATILSYSEECWLDRRRRNRIFFFFQGGPAYVHGRNKFGKPYDLALLYDARRRLELGVEDMADSFIAFCRERGVSNVGRDTITRPKRREQKISVDVG